MDYVQENVARGQTRNVITSGNDRYVAAIVGLLQLNIEPCVTSISDLFLFFLNHFALFK